MELKRQYPQSLHGLVNSDVPAVPTVSSEHSNARCCHVGMGCLLHRLLFHLGYCSCCNPATLGRSAILFTISRTCVPIYDYKR
ncbi:Cellulose synthase-like protein D2 [Frankliniella fusca]|uniref:Cellulose synthase-like protein D2 n=1 Tax=Frankliniella fusca TaxID=407009 RepID=A0AAE1H149_9NEOP|nr:Cellulose synthase-like protein D2 [Frankliniella fusca]